MWVQDGVPLSWRHFVYGLAHLSRALASDTLRASQAAGAGWMKPEDMREWTRDLKRAAGMVWRR